MNKTEVKVFESVGKDERRRGRRAKWEEIDEKIGKEVGVGKRKKKAREDEAGNGDEWVDEEDVPVEITDVGKVPAEQIALATTSGQRPQEPGGGATGSAGVEDEIL